MKRPVGPLERHDAFVDDELALDQQFANAFLEASAFRTLDLDQQFLESVAVLRGPSPCPGGVSYQRLGAFDGFGLVLGMLCRLCLVGRSECITGLCVAFQIACGAAGLAFQLGKASS